MKIVKWFLIGLMAMVLSTEVLRADANDLYNKATLAMGNGDYVNAGKLFDQIIQDYPTSPNIDDVRLRAGFAYLRLNDFDKAVDRLAKEAAPNGPPANRPTALFYTGLAQLSAGNKLPEGSGRVAKCQDSVATMKTLIDLLSGMPSLSADNADLMEQAYYNQSLAYFYANDLTSAEKNLLTLLQKFPNSLSRPDYQLLLGNLYAQEANKAAGDKKPDDQVKSIAAQATAAFDQAASDPNALIQGNQANLAKAEVLYFVAALDLPNTDGYQKALDAFRLVRRKDDLIPQQQANLTALVERNRANLVNAPGGAAMANANSRLIDRETGQLADLKSGPDPIIEALIRIAECYNSMKQGDEARTVLHRLAHATLTKDEQQQVDFSLIDSYVLGGQSDKADKALTAYLAAHPGDSQAQGISVMLADGLMKVKNYDGALAQANRSLKDFPNGGEVSSAIELKVAALTALGRLDEAKSVGDDFIKANPTSPAAIGIRLSAAQRETANGDLNGALADYQKVRDDPHAAPEIQANGAAGYIQTLQSLGRTDEVITEAKAFETKFATSPVLPNILVLGALASDQKHDPGAVAALQDVAKRYPADTADSPAPFALFYVVSIYQRAGKIPEMIQAATDLQKAFPTQYSLLLQAADAVAAADIKDKKFDQAVALYQPLTSAPKADIASQAQAKIGDVWLQGAKALGHYQSMTPELRTEAEKRLGAAEQAFISVLKNSGDQLTAVDQAFRGLDDSLERRRSWGLLKQPDFETYFTKLTSDLTDPGMMTRVELAKAGLVFLDKKGASQYPAALARFRAAVAANPNLTLTRTESNRYGELLLAAKDYPTVVQVYTALLNSDTKDPQVQADADYGLGASYLAQGDLEKAKTYFTAMMNLPGKAAWHPHILDAEYGLALASERSTQQSDLDTAKQTYGAIIQNPNAGVELQAKAMLGYGRMLEKEGHALAPATPGTIEFAVHYYQQVDTIFGPAVAELSAEGLYDAGQAYDKAGDKANAQKQYQTLITNYKTTAPDWVTKAQALIQ